MNPKFLKANYNEKCAILYERVELYYILCYVASPPFNGDIRGKLFIYKRNNERNSKPENLVIWLQRNYNANLLKLIDFGT